MNKPSLLMDSDRSGSTPHQSLKGWQPLGKNWRCSAALKVRCSDVAMDRSRLVRVVFTDGLVRTSAISQDLSNGISPGVELVHHGFFAEAGWTASNSASPCR